MLFYQLYYGTISLTNLKTTHASISFITWFCRKSNCALGFKIRSSAQITENSDNRGSTVLTLLIDAGL